MILDFNELASDQLGVGSKAYVLSMMFQKKYPVPAGLILTHLPTTEEDWSRIQNWWEGHGCSPLAVRSSAFGEDSEEMSFAGQNQTFLNITNLEDLKVSIIKCFQSVNRDSSQSYRQFFMGQKTDVPMNVLLQLMVDPLFAGVYFSVNPIKSESGAIIEYVEGIGESLVSGKVTPYQVLKETKANRGPLPLERLHEVFNLGEKIENELNQKIDMEWAVGKDGQVYLLQARPITSIRSETRQKEFLSEELKRIHQKFSNETWWDGQTFAEWTGQPSPLTFDVWKMAFAPGGAFDSALKELGYLGFSERSFSPHESIMDDLFGRAFINMEKMVPLYFGPIPYRIDPSPRPHLKFEWYKISPTGILNTPKSLWNMVKVGWNMSTARRAWIEKSRKELVDFKHKMQRPQTGDVYSNWDNEALLNLFQKETTNFSKISLKWPLVLVILIEATHQSLRAILSSVVGEDKVEEILGRWMGAGLKTATFEMNRYFLRAMEEPKKREFFFSRFGHRGPGELDLSHPRWEEIGELAFGSGKVKSALQHAEVDVEREIQSFKTFKDGVLRDEWNLLKELLELREQWKMEILRPYAHIRYISLELAKRSGFGSEIFNLTKEEIENLIQNPDKKNDYKKIAGLRKERAEAFKGVFLSDILKREEIEKVLVDNEINSSQLRGIPLSHGVVKGTVQIVNDPSDVDFSSWPEDAILVAPSTDPGWTALFTRSRGIIVERGGVLSHCAILSRELGLPSVNLARATQILKNGDHIWIDGHNGGIKNDNV